MRYWPGLIVLLLGPASAEALGAASALTTGGACLVPASPLETGAGCSLVPASAGIETLAEAPEVGAQSKVARSPLPTRVIAVSMLRCTASLTYALRSDSGRAPASVVSLLT